MEREDDILTILKELQTKHYYEFRRDGKQYLLQPDNNKGCDYLSLWRMDDPPVRVRQVDYELTDGIDEETVRSILNSQF